MTVLIGCGHCFPFLLDLLDSVILDPPSATHEVKSQMTEIDYHFSPISPLFVCFVVFNPRVLSVN